MSTPVPPEVPEEFAAAYREAYERALAEQSPGARHVELDSDVAPPDVPEDDRWAHELPRRAVPPAEGGARVDPDAGSGTPLSSAVWTQATMTRLPTWRAVLVLAAVICLVLGAYLLGSVLGG